MTAFVLVIVAAGLALVGWFVPTPLRKWLGAALLVLTVAAGVLTLFGNQVIGADQNALVLCALLLTVCGGALVTTTVFDYIDRGYVESGNHNTMKAAGEVLRGGAWIGALERVAIFATLAARWPEGIAIILAVKGLGRYPELRAPMEPASAGGVRGHRSGATERFVIGTMVSMLWAVLCIYIAFAPYDISAHSMHTSL